MHNFPNMLEWKRPRKTQVPLDALLARNDRRWGAWEKTSLRGVRGKFTHRQTQQSKECGCTKYAHQQWCLPASVIYKIHTRPAGDEPPTWHSTTTNFFSIHKKGQKQNDNTPGSLDPDRRRDTRDNSFYCTFRNHAFHCVCRRGHRTCRCGTVVCDGKEGSRAREGAERERDGFLGE